MADYEFSEFQGAELDERVVDIARVSKVVKGGRHISFRAVVVVGDNNGTVGLGIGKAREVPDAIRKGADKAKRSMVQVNLSGTTIPHSVTVKLGSARVLLRPASPGTGVIAGSSVRAVVEAAGIRDILTKSLGSPNKLNVVQATLRGLEQLKSSEDEAQVRGKAEIEVMPFWRRRRE